jgi:hypothetical protein
MVFLFLLVPVCIIIAIRAWDGLVFFIHNPIKVILAFAVLFIIGCAICLAVANGAPSENPSPATARTLR